MDKNLIFRGDSRKRIQGFSAEAQRKTGFELRKVQSGLEPSDVKPLNQAGVGVRYIRVRVSDGIYRTVFYSKYEDAVYILHAFKKKSQTIPNQDMELIKQRFKELQNERKNE